MVTAAVGLANLAAERPNTAVDAATVDRLCGRYANLWRVLDVVRLGVRALRDRPVGPRPGG